LFDIDHQALVLLNPFFLKKPGNLAGADSKIVPRRPETIELVEPPDLPPRIGIRWAEKPSIARPVAYANCGRRHPANLR
jgi:hypothetical protein